MIKTFKSGEALLTEGEDSREAYLIRSGLVSVWRMRNGEKVHLAVKAEGEVVGEISVIDETNCTATVTAETDVVAEVITQDDLKRMLDRAPELLGTIIRQLMESLHTANDLVSMYSARIEE